MATSDITSHVPSGSNNTSTDTATKTVDSTTGNDDSIIKKFGTDYKTNGLMEATAANDAKRQANTMSLDEMDAQFVMRGFIAATTEIKTSDLEIEGGTDDKAKQLAQDIRNTHIQIREGIKAIGAAKNITLPVKVGELHEIKPVSTETGAERDKAYVKLMVDNHTIFLDKFKQEVNSGKDEELKAWATTIIPVLEENLAKATALWNTMQQ